MSVLLFRLNGVPDDEANDIRELLDNNDLSYYETSAGKWGISTAAIWLIDEDQLQKAQLLIEEYEKERLEALEKLKSESNENTEKTMKFCKKCREATPSRNNHCQYCNRKYEDV